MVKLKVNINFQEKLFPSFWLDARVEDRHCDIKLNWADFHQWLHSHVLTKDLDFPFSMD